jgi:hypothetical protein
MTEVPNNGIPQPVSAWLFEYSGCRLLSVLLYGVHAAHGAPHMLYPLHLTPSPH